MHETNTVNIQRISIHIFKCLANLQMTYIPLIIMFNFYIIHFSFDVYLCMLSVRLFRFALIADHQINIVELKP